MTVQRPVELLAPARDVECAFAAIDHGADAVYIGASRFGARASAVNSVEDIARVAAYAHQFRVKVYVTVNTILKDEELADTERLIWDLYRAGADALIVQDMALLALSLPPIPLHASTQMDNRTPGKVRFLQSLGFSQVVLARELSLGEIRAVHEACGVPLEVFVHGALCVSYSGQCYVSQHCFGRSANRGECAQFCRLKFDLEDRDGRLIEKGKHLLSLKDMNRGGDLERLLDAGVSSLKIEGRLKQPDYVRQTVGAYRMLLDAPEEEFRKLAKIPILIVYGDNIATEPSTIFNVNIWRLSSIRAKQFADALNRRGGDVRVIRLPELGIRGNTHAPFADRNNLEIADLLERYLHEKGLDGRDRPHSGPARKAVPQYTIPLQDANTQQE